MAKLSVLEREKKKRKLNNYYKDKINLYKNLMRNRNNKIKYNLIYKMQKIPKNAFKVRQVNRCFVTGRARGVFRRFGLSRHVIKYLACKGEIPGIMKSSW